MPLVSSTWWKEGIRWELYSLLTIQQRYRISTDTQSPGISIGTEKVGSVHPYFERGMVVGARRAGLSISETADLLGSTTLISATTFRW